MYPESGYFGIKAFGFKGWIPAFLGDYDLGIMGGTLFTVMPWRIKRLVFYR